MLQAIRDRATGWIAYGIVGFLVIPFAFWGIDQYQGGGQIDVAEVEGTAISLQEFQRAYQQRQARLQSMLGDRYDPASLDEVRLKREVLDELINARLMTAIVVGEGYRISDEQLARAIHDMAPFQVDGRFDSGRYEELLQRQGMSKTGFEESMRLDLASMQVQAGVSGSYAVPDAELERLIALRNQRREVSYAILSIAPHLAAVSITDDELAEWFAENAERFVAPEQAKVAYVELDVATLAAEQSVDEAAVHTRYEEQKDRFGKPVVRRAAHVLVRAPQDGDEEAVENARLKAQEIYDQINAGTITFDEAMDEASADSSGSLEAGELGPVTPGMMDEKFESALYALSSEGAISQPVRTAFGFHLIRLDGEDSGGTKAFEEVRDELLDDLKREQAEGVFFELADQLATIAFENPDSLAPVADRLGLEVQESDWFSRDSGAGIAQYANLRDVAFGPEVQETGLNSELIELNPSHVVVIRASEHRPSREQPLEEVRDQALEALTRARAEEALSAASRGMLEAARSGRAGVAVHGGRCRVARGGADWPNRERDEPSDRPRGVPNASAGGGAPVFGEAVLDSDRRAIIQVSSVISGDPSDVDSALRDNLRLALARQYGSSESQAMLRALRDRANIEVFADRL